VTKINCIIAGVGGQGIVLASKLIAAAAMNRGLPVRTTETIGMAQRGGSVVSHVRMGGSIHSPLVPRRAADLILAFEPSEAVRMTPYLSDGGSVVVCDSAVLPASGAPAGGYPDMIGWLKTYVPKLSVVSGERLIARCGGTKTLNVALLGAAMPSGIFPFDAVDMILAIKGVLPERFWEINIAAFETGRESIS
jgi:indolepyruvate ferredoxin oxidoreductase beta subunit